MSQRDQETGLVAVPPGQPESFVYSAIFDQADPESVINLVADRFRQAMLEVPVEYYDNDEGELRKLCDPSHTDYALRVSFWREYDRAITSGSKVIRTRNVFGGICSEGYFYSRFLRDPLKVAWIVRPVREYKKEMEALLVRGTTRLYELLDIPIKDAKGNVNIKNAELVLKVVQEIANRTKGMAVQRVSAESKTVRMNINAAGPKPAQTEDLAELRRRLAQLEKPNGALPQGPQSGVVLEADPVTDGAEVRDQEGEREEKPARLVQGRDEDAGLRDGDAGPHQD